MPHAVGGKLERMPNERAVPSASGANGTTGIRLGTTASS